MSLPEVAPPVERRAFGSSVVWVTIFMVISGASLGGSAVLSARALGPSGRGAFVVSLTLAVFLALLGSCGVGLSGRRRLASAAPRDRTTLPEFRALQWRLMLAQLPIAAIAAFVVLPAIGARESTSQQIVFVAYSVLFLGAGLSRDALYGVGGSRQSSAINAIASVVLLVGVICLPLVGQTSVAAYLAIFALSALFEFVTAIVVASRRSSHHVEARGSGQLLALLRSGPPALVLTFAQMAVLRGDRLIIGAMTDTRRVGLYSVAATATEFMSLGAFAVAQVLFHPVASKKIEPSTVNRLRSLAFYVTAALCLTLFVIAPWVVSVVLGDAFEDAVPLLRVLALAAIPYATYQMDVYYLAAAGHVGLAARVSVVGTATLIVADVVLILAFGVNGAAYACLLAYCAIAILARFAVRTQSQTQSDSSAHDVI
ncbi:MAG: polysaccharide biosynthesis C-terminal domain-containing protein [Actinomycetia bacterium]|nr:polysaccharide biosynthesis C-terminal domain-containing protein [Actinomycetes bacterium]